MPGISNRTPVSNLEFASALDALSPGLRIAVAVSGGADSMALLRLACQWRQAQPAPVTLFALTVDHGLRDGSAAETQQVALWCHELGVGHRTLQWEGVKPQGDIQAAARRARYDLLSAASKQLGADCLLLGHQFDDQAETLLLRLGRGSGVDGLAAMLPAREWGGVRLLRPLLDFPGRRLRATLEVLEQPWIEDPSNQNMRFARVRARSAIDDLARAGISSRRLVAAARHLRRARTALESMTGQVMEGAVQWEPSGYAALRLEPLFAAPEEIGLRVLSRVLMAIGGGEYPPRLARLESLYFWLRAHPGEGGRTLSGCRVLPGRDGIIVARELSAVGAEINLAPGAESRWDGRFQVRLGMIADDEAGRFTVREVGNSGLRQMRHALLADRPPRLVSQTVPGLWRGQRLLAVPNLGFQEPECHAAAAFEAYFAPKLWPEKPPGAKNGL